jgi:hypothetical protein
LKKEHLSKNRNLLSSRKFQNKGLKSLLKSTKFSQPAIIPGRRNLKKWEKMDSLMALLLLN